MESKQASKSDLFNQQGWFSWGSPVALGIALMSVGVFFALIALGIRILADTPY